MASLLNVTSPAHFNSIRMAAAVSDALSGGRKRSAVVHSAESTPTGQNVTSVQVRNLHGAPLTARELSTASRSILSPVSGFTCSESTWNSTIDIDGIGRM